MVDISSISERLRSVLQEMEKIMDDCDTIQAQAESIANDDFLTRTSAAPKNDN